jgi:glycosyltransferase involved in cell wall biosynthesis
VASDTPLLVTIGKLAPGRGFEDAIATFAAFRRSVPDARLMIIGHGPHQPALAESARELGVSDAIIWAGYHEEDLAEHYRAGDILLFTAAGSDEGHRAILEAMACGLTPATYPIPGVAALLGDELAPRLVASNSTPDSLALTVSAIIAKRNVLRAAAVRQAQNFGYSGAAARLQSAYSSAM